MEESDRFYVLHSQEVCVSRKDMSAVPQGDFQEVTVADVGIVEGIETEKSQPSRKTTEHRIRDITRLMWKLMAHSSNLVHS